ALEPLAELAADLEQEGARAHRGVAHLQREELRGRGVGAELVQERAQGGADDRRGPLARGVVGAGAAAVLAGGPAQGAGRDDVDGSRVAGERGGEALDRGGGGERFAGAGAGAAAG